MIPEMVVFSQVLGLSVMCAAAFAAIFLTSKYFYQRTSRVPGLSSGADSERLRRLEEAMDSIAVEIERMSEAQRFTAKLLLERGGDTAVNAENAVVKRNERTTTPH